MYIYIYIERERERKLKAAIEEFTCKTTLKSTMTLTSILTWPNFCKFVIKKQIIKIVFE